MNSENVLACLASVEERLAWMDADAILEADQNIRAIGVNLAGIDDADLDRLHRGLERLRRALAFVHDLYGKRLEAASPAASVYDGAGSAHHLRPAELQITA